MFNFFKKKKDNKTEKQPVSEPIASEKPILPVINNAPYAEGTFEKKYSLLVQKHKNSLSTLKDKAQYYTKKEDYTDKNEWVDALAICDIALSENMVDDTIKELYRQIYTKNRNKYVSMDYNDEDYDFWFRTNVDINDRFIKAGVTRGYCEQFDLYASSRVGYQNREKKLEYLLKGVEVNDPASLADYGYNIFIGNPEYGEKDKDKARQLLGKSKELGYESAQLLILYMDFYDNEGKENPELLKRIEDYIDKTEPANNKPYHLLADYYLRLNALPEENLSVEENNVKIGEQLQANFEKALEAMKKGLETGSHFCEYLLGMNILNERIVGAEKQEGISLLEKSIEYQATYPQVFLGRYYQYTEDENQSLEKAMECYRKASLYGEAGAMLELARIYLYDETYKDLGKGLKYLEQAIEYKNDRALSEKAYLMLETDILPTDTDAAKALLEEAMEIGNEYAPYRLGLGYQNAEFVADPDYNKALELFEVGAERGHLYSIESAGNYYRVGVGGESPEAAQKAVEYLSRAREMNSNYARVELAFCYEMGIGVEKDYQMAFDLYKEAANNNYPYANTKMAVYYEDGILGEPDLAEALRQYQVGVEAGIPDAIYNIGRYNKYAVGIPENPTEAIRLFDLAAQGGSLPGLVEMALTYENEYGGTDFDAQKAMEYMVQAAEKGYSFAQYKMGTYYYYGLIESNLETAVEWFTRAFEEGKNPHAAIMLGDIYLYNQLEASEPDYTRAFNYYKSAEEQGFVSDGIGVCYDYGLGVEQNETEAFKYYTLAANNGYTNGKYRLGLAYKQGTGTTENFVEAYRWLSDAAENGNHNAQYEAAMMLLEGEGVGQDEAQAIAMLTKVAEEEHSQAQFELGNCYLSGRGVAEDEVQAMYWYQKAADNGNEQAQKITGKRDRRRG